MRKSVSLRHLTSSFRELFWARCQESGGEEGGGWGALRTGPITSASGILLAHAEEKKKKCREDDFADVGRTEKARDREKISLGPAIHNFR